MARNAARVGGVALLCLLLSACGDMSSKLVGEWVQMSGNSPNSVLTLNEDGTGQFQPRGGVAYQIDKWTVNDPYLTMEIPGATVIAQFELDDRLSLDRVDEFAEFNGSYKKQ